MSFKDDVANILPTVEEMFEIDYVLFKECRDAGESDAAIRAFFGARVARLERAYQDELAARRAAQ